MTDGICEAFAKMGELAYALGVRNINRLPGCWEYQLDPQWWLAVNGRPEPTKCSRGPVVPFGTLYVEYNGFPAGLITAAGGTMAAGSAANEAALIAALDRAIAAATAAAASGGAAGNVEGGPESAAPPC